MLKFFIIIKDITNNKIINLVYRNIMAEIKTDILPVLTYLRFTHSSVILPVYTYLTSDRFVHYLISKLYRCIKFKNIIIFWFVYIGYTNPGVMSLSGTDKFLTDIHSGSHKHAYIYSFLCPVVMMGRVDYAVNLATELNLFYASTFMLFCFVLNELLCQDRYLFDKVLSVFNVFIVLNLFNPIKAVVTFNIYTGFNKSLFYTNCVLVYRFFLKTKKGMYNSYRKPYIGKDK